MRTFAQKPDPHPEHTSSNLVRGKIAAPWPSRIDTGSLSRSIGHDFGRMAIHSHQAGAIQAKLTINAPGDPYEQEADRISQQVMRMPELQLQRACSCGGTCSKCETEQEQIQRKAVTSSDAGGSSAPPKVHDVLSSSGQPLDAQTRAFFEPRFGYSFDQVRIHTSGKAAESAEAIGAMAYTSGREIVFGKGKYSPQTSEGKQLLAHELTHAIQQGSSSVAAVQRAPEVQVEPGAACNLDQHRKIEPAAYKARDWLSRALPALDAFISGAKTREAQAVATALGKHFHSTDIAVGTYVRDRLKTILDDIFHRENFHVECRPADDPGCKTARKTEALTAYVPAGNPNALVFCGSFFDRGEEDRASTIIHEFGHAQLHLTAKQDIIDRAYQWDAYYPYLTTAEALTNADSYPMFVREAAAGTAPTKGVISDDETNCPADWNSLIVDAMTKARMWNHRAAKVRGGAPGEFPEAFKKLDAELASNVGFKCKPHGGGRCDKDTDFFWYALGDLRVCARWTQVASPDERAVSMLAALYGYKAGVDGDDKRDKMAREAQMLHLRTLPSTDDVLSGK